MMLKGKKGLSDVVTTVLIILLVLAAVIIVWSFVKPLILGGGETIATTADCIKVDLQPISCVYNVTTDIATVQVKRTGGEVNLKAIKLISQTLGGEIKTSSNTSVLGVLETKTYTYSSSENITQVSVGALLAGDSGKEVGCSESTVKVTCTNI